MGRIRGCSGLVVFEATSGTLNSTTLELNFTITGRAVSETMGTMGSPCGIGAFSRIINDVVCGGGSCLGGERGAVIEGERGLCGSLLRLSTLSSSFGICGDYTGFIFIGASFNGSL